MLDNTLYNAIVTATVSAIITNVCLWWHKKADYKRDYYKKIIDKRMNAYQKLSNTISYIGLKSVCKFGDESRLMHICSGDIGKLKKANESIVSLKEEMFWLSKEVSSELTKLNTIIADFIDQFNEDWENEISWDIGDIMDARTELYDTMESTLLNIKKYIEVDIAKLDDVEEFFKEQRLK